MDIGKSSIRTRDGVAKVVKLLMPSLTGRGCTATASTWYATYKATEDVRVVQSGGLPVRVTTISLPILSS